MTKIAISRTSRSFFLVLQTSGHLHWSVSILMELSWFPRRYLYLYICALCMSCFLSSAVSLGTLQYALPVACFDHSVLVSGFFVILHRLYVHLYPRMH